MILIICLYPHLCSPRFLSFFSTVLFYSSTWTSNSSRFGWYQFKLFVRTLFTEISSPSVLLSREQTSHRQSRQKIPFTLSKSSESKNFKFSATSLSGASVVKASTNSKTAENWDNNMPICSEHTEMDISFLSRLSQRRIRMYLWLISDRLSKMCAIWMGDLVRW